MSIEQLDIKTNCVIWRNIHLPHPETVHTSPVFSLDDGHSWYFEVSCTWCELQDNSGFPRIGPKKWGEEWKFKMKCSKDAIYLNYVIIPYMETKERYIRVASTITNTQINRLSLSGILGTRTDTITMLFLYSKVSIEKNFIGSSLKMSEKESKQCLCLEGLSKDIGQLFNNVETADVTLKCGEKSFSIHRNILTARSEVFAAMFKHNMLEKNSGIVDIVDMDSNILELFLRFLYSGKVEEMSLNTAFELYQAAEKYSVSTLKQLCVPYIMDNMSEDIVYDVLLLADKAGDAEFLDNIATFIVKIEGFFKSTVWKEFAAKFPAIAVKVYSNYFK